MYGLHRYPLEKLSTKFMVRNNKAMMGRHSKQTLQTLIRLSTATLNHCKASKIRQTNKMLFWLRSLTIYMLMLYKTGIQHVAICKYTIPVCHMCRCTYMYIKCHLLVKIIFPTKIFLYIFHIKPLILFFFVLCTLY
jgi:hypothetical protein